MVNKKFLVVLLTLFLFFLVSCNTQKVIKSNFKEEIPDIISTNSDMNYIQITLILKVLI